MAMRTTVPEARLEMLRKQLLFRGLGDEELAEIDALVDDIEVDPGEVLTREGHLGRESYIVVSGEAEVRVHGDTVARLGPGAFFGEMAMIDLKPRTATVTAATPMQLLV